MLVSYIYVNITTFVFFYCLYYYCLRSQVHFSSTFASWYTLALLSFDQVTGISIFFYKKKSNRVTFGNELKSKHSLNLVPICVWVSFRTLYPLIYLSSTQAKCPDHNDYSWLKKRLLTRDVWALTLDSAWLTSLGQRAFANVIQLRKWTGGNGSRLLMRYLYHHLCPCERRQRQFRLRGGNRHDCIGRNCSNATSGREDWFQGLEDTRKREAQVSLGTPFLPTSGFRSLRECIAIILSPQIM